MILMNCYSISEFDNFIQTDKKVLLICSNKDILLEFHKNLSLCNINDIYLLESEKTDDFKDKYKITSSIDNDQDVTIIINPKKVDIELLSEINTKIVILFINCFSGLLFVDAGENFITYSENNKESFYIKDITLDGTVTCCQNTIHNLQTNDYIYFSNLEGSDINFLKEKDWQIQVINKTSFKLLNFNNSNNFMLINGCVNYRNTAKIYSHKKFSSFINDIDPKYFSDFNYQFLPVISIMTALASFEVIKLMINRFDPINQLFAWNEEILQNCINNNYDDTITNYGKIFGKEFEIKLLNSKWIIIGCNGIGHENFKNLMSMDIGNKKLGSSEIIMLDDIDINNELFINLNGILLSSDNIDYCKNISEKCFDYNIPLFESYINGYKGYIEPIIPFITDTYYPSKIDCDKSYPLCVINNFPNNNHHIFLWAQDKLESILKIFDNYDNYNNNIIINDEQFKNNIESLKNINTINDILIFAHNIFNEFYNNNIIKLLETYDKNDTVNGKLFWSEGKLCPNPLLFDNANIIHNNFIYYTLMIFLKYYKFDQFDNITNINYHEFKNNKIYFNFNKIDHNDDIIINWLLYCSNLRELNYNISLSNYVYIKNLVNKTVQKLPILDILVSGLTIIETIKSLYINDNYKSSSINLSFPSLIQYAPIKSPIINIGDSKVNKWTKFTYNNNTKLSEFKSFYEKIFECEITMIVFDNALVYSTFLDTDKIDTLISDITDSKKISVSLLCDKDIDIPTITINL